MPTRNTLRALVLGALTTLAVAQPASAAYVLFDDSDPTTITITAGDWERGFSVNGNQLTIGLGQSGSITLPDAGYTFSGSWIDLGQSAGRVDILFTFGNSNVMSGVEGALSTDGVFGTIAGSFGGYTGSTYYTTGLPTFTQNGQTVNQDLPFMSLAFRSEAVPEPGTLALLGLGLAGLAATRRRLR